MTVLLIPAALIFLLVAWMLIRTLLLQRHPKVIQPVEKPRVDRQRITGHLAEAVRIRTVSRVKMSPEDYQSFLEMHTWMQKSYPLIAGKLNRQVINQFSLLYTWEGSDRGLKPVLFNAHMDVVPVDEATVKEWKVDPFEGEIKEGSVWGHGSLDMKCNLVGILEAVETLVEEGFQPKRTIYLAFGHDEEIMGFEESLKIMQHLKSRGVQLAALLDEGGMISLNEIEGVEQSLALIGITEKGYLTLKLSAEGKAGHSSRPPRQTAIGIIARAIALMDNHPMRARTDCFLPTLRKIGYALPLKWQFVVANANLLSGMLIRWLESKTETNALVHTTHAATMISSGIKDNVLPSIAEVRVNLRLLPGDSIPDVISHFSKVVNDLRVKMEIDEKSGGWEASHVASTDNAAYRTLELVVRQMFDDVPAAPYMFMAATDSRHYDPICKNVFKFSPYLITPEGRSGVHGVNERISQEALVGIAGFYQRLMRVWGEAEF